MKNQQLLLGLLGLALGVYFGKGIQDFYEANAAWGIDERVIYTAADVNGDLLNKITVGTAVAMAFILMGLHEVSNRLNRISIRNAFSIIVVCCVTTCVVVDWSSPLLKWRNYQESQKERSEIRQRAAERGEKLVVKTPQPGFFGYVWHLLAILGAATWSLNGCLCEIRGSKVSQESDKQTDECGDKQMDDNKRLII